ncbi:hypothetical protein RHMOL_Rhmol01G0242700 [Rhododendron molle]|uniref:Uncharacterized protein n=1 Tax=Rhododendron molle TaxID=49168 RepID=A0ACC0Q6C5_RHOML|nr:hypothetical protein RHMOL_Rhmol01G0242700 [Rhododendron molle]
MSDEGFELHRLVLTGLAEAAWDECTVSDLSTCIKGGTLEAGGSLVRLCLMEDVAAREGEGIEGGGGGGEGGNANMKGG